MTHDTGRGPKSSAGSEMAQRFYSMQDRSVRASLDKMRTQFAKYAVPAQELRAMLDETMGDRTLTEELHRLREE